MILRFVEWMIGPSGVKVLNWLDQRGLWVYGIVLITALLAVVFPGPRARIAAWLERTREKLGMAPTAEERVSLQQLREKRLGPARGKKRPKDAEPKEKGTNT
jgi:hypothetical protein